MVAWHQDRLADWPSVSHNFDFDFENLLSHNCGWFSLKHSSRPCVYIYRPAQELCDLQKYSEEKLLKKDENNSRIR
jgi:hypothetical protein